MAVGCVLAEADVGDEDQRIELVVALERAQALLRDAVGGVGSAGLLVLGVGQAEEKQAAETERGAGFRFLHRLVDGEVEDAGHGGDFLADAFAGADEDGLNERGGGEVGFADEGAQGFGAAETAQARGGEVHG